MKQLASLTKENYYYCTIERKTMCDHGLFVELRICCRQLLWHVKITRSTNMDKKNDYLERRVRQ